MFICLVKIENYEEDCGRSNWREELQMHEGETYQDILNTIADIKIGIKENNPDNKWNATSATFSGIYEVARELTFSNEDILKTQVWIDYEEKLRNQEAEKIRLQEEKTRLQQEKLERECEALRLKEIAQQEADMATYLRIKAQLNQEVI